jgi:tetratricopeptide (TPR) repeat protein
LAQIFQQQDKLQAAVDVYKDLEKIFPRQPYIKSCLGTTLREMGASDLAVQYFKEALQLDRTMLISRILLAKTLLERFGDRGKAEATKILYDGLTVHKYQEGVSEVYMMLAEILDESRKYSQACDVLKQLVTFQQKNARAKIMLGKMLLKRKDYKSALKYLQQARELQPYDSETFLYLGKVYLSLNKLDDAESALEQSVQLNPAFGHGEGYRLLGKLNLKRGKLHEALEKFREFTSRRTQDPEGYIRMAEIALELGDESLTNQNLGEALELWVSRFQKSGAIAFRKHPEDLRVLRNMSQKCVSSTLISGSLCAKISLLISDIDSQKTE